MALISDPSDDGLVPEGAMVVRPDDSVVVPGSRLGIASTDAVLFGLTRRGSTDQSFGASEPGATVLDQEGPRWDPTVVRDPSGDLIVAGLVGGSPRIAIERLTASGGRDRAFGYLGIDQVSDVPPIFGHVGLAEDEQGRVLVAGVTNSGQVLVSRRLRGGGPDPSFGQGGVVVLPGDGEPLEHVRLALAPDGDIVIAFGDYGLFYTVVRLTAGGDPDQRFAGTGTVKRSFGEGSEHGASVSDLAITPDGEILIAGEGAHATRHGGLRSVPKLELLTARGHADRSFGRRGVVSFLNVKSGPGFHRSEFYAIAVQRNGRIVAAGERDEAFLAVRYLPDGRSDRSFSRNGRVTTRIDGYASARSVGLASHGKVVLAGSAFGSGPSSIAVARYVGRNRR